MRQRSRGQSFVEYIILVTVILAVVVVVAEGPFQNGVDAIFNKSTEGVKIIADQATPN